MFLVGTVKWFSDKKGYGFIEPEGSTGKDVYVHFTGIAGTGRKTLREGQKVQYEATNTPRGVAATNVRVI